MEDPIEPLAADVDVDELVGNVPELDVGLTLRRLNRSASSVSLNLCSGSRRVAPSGALFRLVSTWEINLWGKIKGNQHTFHR
jgi:hypothetical protein